VRKLQCSVIEWPRAEAEASMCDMSTDSGTQDVAVPREATADYDSNADASPPLPLEQMYEQATARLAFITDDWQQARDALLRG
jgi:hypothetical protein